MQASVGLNQLKMLQSHMAIPILLIAMLGMMTLPVPPFLLDLLFTFNIALSLVVLLVCVYALRPMEFAIFPTVLLVATLLRLALNVASTRVVLLEGHEGGDAAGKVIEAFGEVVIGGNYAVGLVVFAILMIINFVVVTKGAGRVSEVSARFTLDAMPGKQMAIDADLNAGIINQEDAKARREEVATEADFYGAMDGASKFVRGDAIAGLLILAINLIGGLSIGMLQHELDFNDAMQKYSLLTIGDGLVAQIPSLLLSTAAAIMVTRVSTTQDMSSQVLDQMFLAPKALYIAAGILGIMGIVPGMPHFAFLTLAAIVGGIGWYRDKKLNEPSVEDYDGPVPNKGGAQIKPGGGPAELPPGESAQDVGDQPQRELGWDDVMSVDIVGLEVGYRLIPMVDKSQGGQLLGRIKGVRKKLSQELGFLMPSVHIRDSMVLMPNAYRITLMGVSLAEAEIHPDRELAINPGQVFGEIEGIAGIDPAFGMEAVWIEPDKKDQAQALGYTVVDASTVVATHMNQLLQKHAYELIGHEEVQQWLDQLGKQAPKLAEELVPNTLSVSSLLKVLQNLLQEDVPIKDMRSIAEALISRAPKGAEPDQLTEACRQGLKRLIVQTLIENAAEIPVITLEPELEQLLLKSVQQAQKTGAPDELGMVLEPGIVENLQRSLSDAVQRQEMLGNPAILLVSAPVRLAMAKFSRFVNDSVRVLSYQEIPDNKQINIVATVGQ
ncbi:flagellar biosynthesis protein FlhA [Oleiphilus sp. HI0071]|jgi:flagellar biosynthesis protein FlhA|nr:flagellar biosynthesis protein FlhA [Oleiphilus sp. HI0080]KZY66900.1 flagellar biosynthesis protein FlhA [Oleiphilus sp. HI0065]KZY83957.1 flagellar biosynthesis protein FlhA [Oleiphilus sp. HI0071]KZY91104.1 flagellar biosynthesis protein FlhA [Oleiphilus sp. HI0073]KZZ42127.1 flagellar biosynthesis protein FlhA [Oleiphilus sp. HI0118]KZZ60426.1 flagellar biosynthesis protein FlhA [Oleiphilus sp. HI0122]KZZ70942.1 flagellar biosynthesis protein FlhA [Oleiphilus sp. HI0130]KZZ81930.1 fla